MSSMKYKNNLENNNNKKIINKITIFILTIIFILLVFTLGFILGRLGFNAAWQNGEFKYSLKGRLYPEEKSIDFDLFWEVWNQLESTYVEKSLDEQDMFYGAIKGLVLSLDDPATRFFDPSETLEYEEEKAGKFDGIGVLLDYLNNKVVIKEVFENTPASIGGLKDGDIIYKVNDEDVTGIEIYEVVKKIRGEKGTIVKITVTRQDQELSFDIERDEVYVESISWEMRDDGIADITVRRFTESNISEFFDLWDKVVNEVVEAQPKGIIIDLRGNGGGYLDGAIYLAGEFLKKGDVVLYIQDREGVKAPQKVTRSGKLLTLPVVLLVDSGTASSSEIFAGALQYYQRAKVIGEDTYGKGTAQDVIEPESWNGASIHITTQKWLLPDQRWINHDDPVNPDIKVEVTIEQIKKGDDPQLDKALEQIKSEM
jgi:carboxyl-terminal processing protease